MDFILLTIFVAIKLLTILKMKSLMNITGLYQTWIIQLSLCLSLSNGDI